MTATEEALNEAWAKYLMAQSDFELAEATLNRALKAVDRAWQAWLELEPTLETAQKV